MAGSFSERLAELMDDRRNISAFARKCDVSDTMMRKYLAGTAMPAADRAAEIARLNGVALLWLVTGEGEKVPGSAAHTDHMSVNPDLLGRIVDRVSSIYDAEHVRLQKVELGRIAAEQYSQIKDMADDAEEWTALLDLMTVRLRKAIRAAAADPANVKRGA